MKKSASGRAVENASPKTSIGYYLVIFSIILVFAGIIAFQPAMKGEFLNWDDNQYVIANPLMKEFSFQYAKDAFCRFELGNYHPLTMISLAMNYTVPETDPYSFHFWNLFFHLMNAIILLFILTRMNFDKWTALFIALLFLLHPTRTEAVAWISGRKEVLYSFFWLLSLLSYISYVVTKKSRYYIFSLLLFLPALLSKGTAVSLAAVVLLTDYYFERPLMNRKVILEKVPFFILALGFGILAVIAQKTTEATESAPFLYLFDRMALALGNLSRYIQLLIVPAGLNAFYPYDLSSDGHLKTGYYLLAALSMVLTGLFVFFVRKSKHSRLMIFGLLFFFLLIFPLLQWFPVGRAVMADRYTYLPAIGIFIFPGLLLSEGIIRRKFRVTAYSLAMLLVVVFTLQTRTESAKWTSNLNLWESVIQRNPDIAIAYGMRGQIIENRGDREAALADYSKALSLDSSLIEILNNRGVLLGWMKRYPAAIADLERAMTLKPDAYAAYSNLGFIYTKSGMYSKALPWLNLALIKNPADPMALGNRAMCRYQLGNREQAYADVEQALDINEKNPMALYARALLLLERRDTTAACSDLQNAVLSGYSALFGSEADVLSARICAR